MSIRKLSCAVGLTYSTTRTILVEDLHLKPYKRQCAQEIEAEDYGKRLKFADWFLNLPEGSENYLISVDEAYFFLTEALNKQNNRLWLESRPNDLIEVPLNDQKLLVWCAISANKIYGPFFFYESVNQHNYLDMLQNFFWPKHLRTVNYKNYYFEQDGATPLI